MKTEAQKRGFVESAATGAVPVLDAGYLDNMKYDALPLIPPPPIA